MNMQEEKTRRNLPPLFPEGMTAEAFPAWRQERLALYARECFGVTPPAPKALRAEIEADREDDWAGKAEHRRVKLTLELEAGEFSFPVHLVLPKAQCPAPCAVYISFTPYATAGYQPIEEVVDHGYAMAVFCYEDVTRDNGDFADGLAAFFPRQGADAPGKISLWAYAAMRVMDYLKTLPEIDSARTFVMGHSRLGKTALWAAAQDERFAAAVSNDSGCSGAAVSRGKVGESVAAIYRQFPFWFCENYGAYGGREDALPFEQYQPGLGAAGRAGPARGRADAGERRAPRLRVRGLSPAPGHALPEPLRLGARAALPGHRAAVGRGRTACAGLRTAV